MSDVFPELVCIGVDVVICGLLCKLYANTISTINAIKTAPSFDGNTQDVRKFVRQNGVKSGSNEVSVAFAVVNGDVSPAATSLTSHFTREKHGVVREFSMTEHKRSLSRAGFWYDSKRSIQHYINSVPFTLGRDLEVIGATESDDLELEVTYDNFDATSTTFSDYLWGWVVGDRQKGIQTSERMLLTGTNLTAVGEVMLDEQTNRVSIQAPTNGQGFFLVQKSPKQLIKEFETGSRVLRVALIIFGSVGLAVASVAAWKCYSEWKRRRIVAGNLDTLSQIARERADVGEDQQVSADIRTCVACLAQQREVILLDCGHVCVCADCAAEIMRTRPQCPVCRAPIDRISAAYIP